jgi:hypothetical protein
MKGIGVGPRAYAFFRRSRRMASASRLENEGSKNPSGESGGTGIDERVLKEQEEPVPGL